MIAPVEDINFYMNYNNNKGSFSLGILTSTILMKGTVCDLWEFDNLIVSLLLETKVLIFLSLTNSTEWL